MSMSVTRRAEPMAISSGQGQAFMCHRTLPDCAFRSRDSMIGVAPVMEVAVSLPRH